MTLTRCVSRVIFSSCEVIFVLVIVIVSAVALWLTDHQHSRYLSTSRLLWCSCDRHSVCLSVCRSTCLPACPSSTVIVCVCLSVCPCHWLFVSFVVCLYCCRCLLGLDIIRTCTMLLSKFLPVFTGITITFRWPVSPVNVVL